MAKDGIVGTLGSDVFLMSSAMMAALLLTISIGVRRHSVFLEEMLAVAATVVALPILIALLRYFTAGQSIAGSGASWFIAILLGLSGGLVFLRLVAPRMEYLGYAWVKRTSLERSRRSDVREMPYLFNKMHSDYKPESFLDGSKGLFLGLNEKGLPCYRFWGDRSNPHIMCIGTTGAGKGIALGLLATQWLARGESVYFFDPKNDEWAPHVIKAAADKAGVPYHFLDLRPQAPAQFNLFANLSVHELEELLLVGCNLIDRGEAADFYSLADRAEAKGAACWIVGMRMTVRDYLRQEHFKIRKKAPKFTAQLFEIADLDAANASGGLDLEKVMWEGGAVYIVGSTRHPIVDRIQKMLLVRLLQMAEKRDRLSGTPRPMAIILDEVKYHLSKTALEALGTARDKGVHVVLSLQSLADLKDVRKDLDAQAVQGALVENCSLKLCYRVQDPETARWLAEMSGTILIDQETRKVSTNIALTETVANERILSQGERYWMDSNMLMNLPPSVAVIYGMGLPTFSQIRPMTVSMDYAAITPVEVEMRYRI